MSEQKLNKNKKQQRIYDLLSAETQPKFLCQPYTKSIKKHVYESKVHEKTVKTAIKQDLSFDLNTLEYAMWSILENKTNATSSPNIGSLKTATEEEWNKMSEEFIFKAYRPF